MKPKQLTTLAIATFIVIPAAFSMSTAKVNKIFNRMDTNKDKRISRVEARGQILQRFKSIDRNNDGFLSRKEVKRSNVRIR